MQQFINMAAKELISYLRDKGLKPSRRRLRGQMTTYWRIGLCYGGLVVRLVRLVMCLVTLPAQ